MQGAAPGSRGACTAHAAAQLQGVGLFLLLRKSSILLLRDDKVSAGTQIPPVPPPPPPTPTPTPTPTASSSCAVGDTESFIMLCFCPQACFYSSVFVDEHGSCHVEIQ